MNRIDRISALLVQLQSRPVVKAGEMAKRFEVSLRTIYRDMRTLLEAGVPICGDAGVGYSLVEGYRLPPLMFTQEEALAFLTAEKLIEKLTDPENSRFFHQGMDKVRAVLRRIDKGYLSNLGETIAIYRNQRIPQAKLPNLIQTLLNSIQTQRAAQMGYFTPSRNQTSDRLIEPVGISYIYPHWHLSAYCHLRQEYRVFRMDRIEQLALTDQPFSRDHPSLQTLLAQLDDPSCLIRMVIRTTKKVSQYMGDTAYYMGLVSEEALSEEWVQQIYMCYSLETMARWVLSNIDQIEVVEPPQLKERIRAIIENRLL